ncbi:MAG: helix-turn-helix transcriptional regulator [Candidatus Eremiobacteraeota bacterium]|nr:helix-turn-helix transcriptional regulator [Candidatus Eremiobacteraeota bacterium]
MNAFRMARFDEAARILTSLDGARSRLLLARLELKRGNPGEVLPLLARAAGGEAAILKGMAFARLGDPKSACAQFGIAQSLVRDDPALSVELLYARASAKWIERKLDAASRTLAKLPVNIEIDLDVQARILRGAIAAAREQLAEQGAILLDALRRVRAGECSAQPHAVLVAQIASLANELPSVELRDAAIEEVPNVPWTRDVGDWHFHALRALAWRHALDGDEFNAFRRLKEAVTVTPSAAWRVAALADRAYLAWALGEERWSAQELRDAHELAATVDWASCEGEEKFALPLLAEMFARRDPAVAMSYVATFKRVGKSYARVLASHRDRRVEALEAYCVGRVQFHLGQHAEARRLLERAWTIYDKLGIRWRAARAALALSQIADASTWKTRAARAAEPYPRSWLARGLDAPNTRVRLEPPPRGRGLTPAQRAVFDLLMEGRKTAEIAKALDRSTYTVRNHVKAIFKIFGVSSRPALIVRALESGDA